LKKKIAILGSTGSIGIQTLDVIQKNKELFTAEILIAGQNSNLLIKQAKSFKPKIVVINDESKYLYVKEHLKNQKTKVFAGKKEVINVVKNKSIDTVVSAVVGYSGLEPTISAIKAGKNIALANKETLVVAGELINNLIKKYKVKMYPIDSEHSAIYQCILGEEKNKYEKIILTASGGPFRGFKLSQLEKVTPHEALNHPKWKMGKKISIDSATLMNKGLEVIEAKWLFDIDPSNIEVVIHPEAIVHSMVQFIDGSIKAQLGVPDMKIPIQFALTSPYRIESNFPRLSLNKKLSLNFEKPDLNTFKNLKLAFQAIKEGGNKPCILNAANEVVVDSFLKKKIKFLEMSNIIEECLNKIEYIANLNFEDYVEIDRKTRILTKKLINK
jgi:1-deoxy-D-xylulose-5-phosphate reductoisomerase